MSKALTCIIIDDNPQCISILRNLLLDYFPEVEIVGESNSVAQGVALLKTIEPDILFLDVEMPTENGTAVFDYILAPSFETIFTTAFEDYAAQAFRLGSIDYLVKPVKPSELKEAINKVKIKKETEPEETSKILNRLDQSDRILFSSSDNIEVYTISDILYCQAESNYTIIQSFEKKSMVSKTLGHYEELLKSYGFFRINRSQIVNLKHVDSVDKAENQVRLKNKTKLLLSGRRKKEFLEELSRSGGQ